MILVCTFRAGFPFYRHHHVANFSQERWVSHADSCCTVTLPLATVLVATGQNKSGAMMGEFLIKLKEGNRKTHALFQKALRAA